MSPCWGVHQWMLPYALLRAIMLLVLWQQISQASEPGKDDDSAQCALDILADESSSSSSRRRILLDHALSGPAQCVFPVKNTRLQDYKGLFL